MKIVLDFILEELKILAANVWISKKSVQYAEQFSKGASTNNIFETFRVLTQI